MTPVPIYILVEHRLCRCCHTESETASGFLSKLSAEGRPSRYIPLPADKLPSLYEIIHISHQVRTDLCVACIPLPGAYSNPTGPIDPHASENDPLALPPLTLDEL